MPSNKIRVAALSIMLYAPPTLSACAAIGIIYTVLAVRNRVADERVAAAESARARSFAVAEEIRKRSAEIRAGIERAGKGRLRKKARRIPAPVGTESTNNGKP